MKNLCYLDNSATTFPLDAVIRRVSETMKNVFGNASSRHSLGLEASKILLHAKNEILGFLGASEGKLCFTSNGTEANNIAIFSVSSKRRGKIITCAAEHDSVLNSVNAIKNKGFEIEVLKPDIYGKILPEQIENSVDENTVLVSTMFVNNETGAINQIEEFSKIIRKKSPGAVFHVDAVQALGKIPISADKIGADFLSLSAHKIHGPKGIGALYISKKAKIKPVMFGGGQEYGIRPGTEAVALAAGFEEAVLNCDIKKNYEKIKEINRYCKSELKKIKEIIINSHEDALPFIINFSLMGIKSEVTVNFLSEKNIFVSGASACSGNKHSHVLTAMRLNPKRIESAVRLSFSRFNSKKDIDLLIKNLKSAVNTFFRL
jgi:cysteine desulfurase